MSAIAEKIGITAEQFKTLVKVGVVSTTWAAKDEIVVYYKQQLQICNRSEAVHRTAEKFNKDCPDIYKILRDPVFK